MEACLGRSSAGAVVVIARYAALLRLLTLQRDSKGTVKYCIGREEDIIDKQRMMIIQKHDDDGIGYFKQGEIERE